MSSKHIKFLYNVLLPYKGKGTHFYFKRGNLMTKYQQACVEREQAHNKCLAELFAESWDEETHITDKNGNPLSKEQIYEKLLRGDKE